MRFYLSDISRRVTTRVAANCGDPNGCWLWRGGVDKDGYGLVKVLGESRRAHRVAWILHHRRDIPDGLMVCHSCDTPRCVNPAHLFLGTGQDNVADRQRKHRQAKGDALANAQAANRARGDRHGTRTHPETIRRGATHPYQLNPECRLRGERNGFAKLNAMTVKAIRDAVAAGASQEAVGQRFGLHQGHVSRIVRRTAWAHVP